MSTEGTLIQSHDYSIALDTWAQHPGINQFLDIV
jgi:hypothetical protein